MSILFSYKGNNFLIGALFVTLSSSCIFGQENVVDILRTKLHSESNQLFDNSLYGLSTYKAEKFSDLAHPLTHADLDDIIITNDMNIAINAMRLSTDGADEKIKYLYRIHKPDPALTPAILELGSYYYNIKQYSKAIETYNQVNVETLADYDLFEASFKKGYCYFVMKEFQKAKDAFSMTKEIKNEFYYSSNYYYGISDYFLGNYQDAVQSFQKVKGSDVYKSFVPYYIAQIYFIQNEPEKVIANGEVSLKDPDLRNRKEIRQLLGQSYFKRKEYDLALPHLHFYEKNTDKLTIDEFYQLSFTQYQLKKYKEAVETFKELSLLDSKLGQVVNYYMADCYYRLNDLVSARAAFKKVSMMSYNLGMQEESTFNYGKLSAEAGFEREAINTLIKLDKDSPYYVKANDIIIDLLDNTTDFASAISIIEGMKKLTSKLESTYQSVCLKNGLLLHSQGDFKNAIKNFEKVDKYKNNKRATIQSKFWIGHIYHAMGDFKNSIKTLEEFFTLSNGVDDLPVESSRTIGYYIQGYNYLETRSYSLAEIAFKNSLVGFSIDGNKWDQTSFGTLIKVDAQIRTGDCVFKSREFKNALSYYNKAIESKQGNFVYAIYQKAIIEGLLDEPYDKVITLKEILTKYPTSDYADDAFFQVGETYIQNDNLDNAYGAYSQLIQKHPNSPMKNQANVKLGLIAYNKGDLNAAIMHYKSIMTNNPTQKEAESALLGLREIYINDLGKPDEYINYASAIPGYEVSAQAADSLAYSVGESKYQDGDYEKAIIGFNNYIDKYPKGFNRLSALYLRGESYTIQKKFNQALIDYESVITLGNSLYYAVALKKAAVIAYNQAQSFDKSLKYYDLYQKITTDEQEKLIANLGIMRSAFRVNNQDQLRAAANAVIAHTNSTKEEKGSGYYYLGKAYQKTSDWENAKSNYKKVETFLSNVLAAESRYQIAEITFNQGKYVDAEKMIESGNEKNTAHPYWIVKGLLLLSDIYVKRDDLLNARAACEAIIENFTEDKDLNANAQGKLKQIEVLEQQKSRIKSTSKNQIDFMPNNKNE